MRLHRSLAIVTVLLLSLALGAVLQAQEPVTITLMGHGSSVAEEEALRAQIAAFEEAHPDIRVDLQIVPEYDTVLQTAFASGDYPEVFYVSQDKVDEFANAGVLAPATDIEDVEDIYPSLVDTFTYQDVFYCPAKDFSTLALEYNVDLFEQAGVDLPTADWTWDDLEQAATAITEATGVPGLVLNPSDIDRWFAFYLQAGGTLYDEAGDFVFAQSDEDMAAAVEATEYLLRLHESGALVTAQEVGAGWPGEAFGQGAAAMTVEGNWIIQYLLDQFPDLNWGVAELPQGAAGQGTLVFSECYGVAVDNEYPEESWTLVDFLTGVEGSARIAESGFGPMPPRISAGPLWLEARGEEFQPFVTGAEYAQAPFLPPGFQEFRDALSNNLAQALEGQMLADEAIEDARDVADELSEE